MVPVRVLIATMRWFGGFADAITRALREEGAGVREVVCRDYRGFGRHKLLERWSRLSPRALQSALPYVLARDRAHCQARLLREAKRFKPDLLLVTDEDAVDLETLEQIHRATGAVRAVWIGDDPFGKPDLMRAIRGYDYLFVFDRYYMAPLRSLTSAKVLYLPVAGDDSVFRRSPLPQSRRWGTIHIGSRYPEREKILAELAGADLEIYGWLRRGLPVGLSKAVRAGRVSRHRANRLYGRAAVVLSLHHRQVRHGATRVFDPALTGAFQITELTPDLGELLEPGKEIVTFESVSELKDKLTYYRGDAGARERIARDGCTRVQAEHTYRHRVRELLRRALEARRGSRP
jgi:spore maturation protein CgeB